MKKLVNKVKNYKIKETGNPHLLEDRFAKTRAVEIYTELKDKFVDF